MRVTLIHIVIVLPSKYYIVPILSESNKMLENEVDSLNIFIDLTLRFLRPSA